MIRDARRALRRSLALAGVGLALLGGGCTSDGAWPMARVPPPDDWPAEVESWRAARDRFFRESAESPIPAAERPAFDGLDYWSPDDEYYFVGTINAYPEPERFTITTTAGSPRPCEKLGWIEFELGGERRRLEVYHLLDTPTEPGEASLFLPFLDATSGEESYPAGRYVDLVGPPGGPWVLDFNRAYNPSCAYGDPARFACPRTPPENRLAVRVEAGERGWAHGGRETAG